MKKTVPLWLLLLVSLTAFAQSAPPLVQMNCLQPSHLKAPGNRNSPVLVGQPAPVSAKLPNPDPGPTQGTCPGIISVNIHYMLRLNGTGNFNEKDDGVAYKPWNANTPQDPIVPADTANNGYARARVLVAEMNNQAASNPPNYFPASTANPPKGFSYALNGVYFHRVSNYDIVKDDYSTYASPVPFDSYGVNKATEINMFLMGDFTNGACCDVSGIASGLGYNPGTPSSYWVKLFNSHKLYRWRQENNGNTIILPGGPYTIPQNSHFMTANSLGHELGHL